MVLKFMLILIVNHISCDLLGQNRLANNRDYYYRGLSQPTKFQSIETQIFDYLSKHNMEMVRKYFKMTEKRSAVNRRHKLFLSHGKRFLL